MGEPVIRSDDLSRAVKPKLLVTELWGIGDLIMATPFLRAASEKFSVTLLAKPHAEDLQRRFWPEVEVIPFTAPWTAFEHKYRIYSWPWREIRQLGKLLGRARFDAGVSARWDPRDHWLMALLRVRRRIGFARMGSGLILSDALPRPRPGTHRYDNWQTLGTMLGLTLPDRAAIPQTATRRGCILVHTGAAQRVRVWPIDRFRNLVVALRREGFMVEVACNASQRDWWVAAGEANVVTPRTVAELIELFDRAAIFIGNDSGPGHIAALNGSATFTIFGPQLPALFAPLHPAATWLEGMPCRYRPCSDYCHFPVPHCLWDLSEETVWPRVREFVAAHADSIQRIEPVSLKATAAPHRSELPVPVRPRRVLHVHNSADIYGASRSLIRLTRTMDRRQFEPVVVLPEAGLLKDFLEAQGVEVLMHPRLSLITRPVFYSWRMIGFLINYPLSALFLWRMIRRRGIDLVHTNTGVILSPALAAKLAGVPHVWHIRDWFQEFRGLWPVLSWYIQTFSKKIIAVSNPIANQFSRREKVSVIYNGFSLEEFDVPKLRLRAEVRSRYGLGEDFVVGCVGRIKLVRKGQEILVRAISLLKQRGVRLKALIVGAPFKGNETHLEQLRDLIAELQVEDRVIFTGELSDTRTAYSAMDVLAMTSAQPEPFGGVVMEAMAMSLPVIATNIGGSLDQVMDGATGILVPPGDPVQLADAIEKLTRDPELCRRMGEAARERIRQHFSLETMTDRIERLFDETIAKKN